MVEYWNCPRTYRLDRGIIALFVLMILVASGCSQSGSGGSVGALRSEEALRKERIALLNQELVSARQQAHALSAKVQNIKKSLEENRSLQARGLLSMDRVADAEQRLLDAETAYTVAQDRVSRIVSEMAVIK